MRYERTIKETEDNLRVVFEAIDLWFDRPMEVRDYRPKDGGWTINEVLEHVTLTNHFLMLTLEKWAKVAIRRATRGELILGEESDLGRLGLIGQRGSFRWERPKHMEPTGRTTTNEVRDRMQNQLVECLQILKSLNRGQGSLCNVQMTVNGLGKIDLYQWLCFIAQHARRHIQQMEAIEREYLAVVP